LGAGSGSISIEASLFIKEGRIYAIEKNPERIEQIKANKERLGVTNLFVNHAVLPEGLESLPAPQRIFIGGGGKELEKIITAASGHLEAEGVMVINTILLENVVVARNTLKRLGYQVNIVQVQVSRGHGMPWGERLEAQNPVWIISGEKGHV